MALTPVQLLRLVSDKLRTSGCLYALCGGIAANVYRSTFRTTNDLDIALYLPNSKSQEEEKEFALKFFEALGIEARIPGVGSNSAHLVSAELGEFLPTLDFILPSLPWVTEAVHRAQVNLIDFGFGEIPTITPEDLILAKAYALTVSPNRVTDKDDIDSILKGQSIKNRQAISELLKRFNLTLD